MGLATTLGLALVAYNLRPTPASGGTGTEADPFRSTTRSPLLAIVGVLLIIMDRGK